MLLSCSQGGSRGHGAVQDLGPWGVSKGLSPSPLFGTKGWLRRDVCRRGEVGLMGDWASSMLTTTLTKGFRTTSGCYGPDPTQ